MIDSARRRPQLRPAAPSEGALASCVQRPVHSDARFLELRRSSFSLRLSTLVNARWDRRFCFGLCLQPCKGPRRRRRGMYPRFFARTGAKSTNRASETLAVLSSFFPSTDYRRTVSRAFQLARCAAPRNRARRSYAGQLATHARGRAAPAGGAAAPKQRLSTSPRVKYGDRRPVAATMRLWPPTRPSSAASS